MLTPHQISRAETIIEREHCLKYLLAEKAWYKNLRRIPGCGGKIAVAVIALALRDGVVKPDDPELSRHLSADDLADVLAFKERPYLESSGLKFRYRALDLDLAGSTDTELLTTTELAERLSIKDHRIRFHRRFLAGPPAVNGSRAVHYRLADVRNWLADRGKIKSF